MRTKEKLKLQDFASFNMKEGFKYNPVTRELFWR